MFTYQKINMRNVWISTRRGFLFVYEYYSLVEFGMEAAETFKELVGFFDDFTLLIDWIDWF